MEKSYGSLKEFLKDNDKEYKAYINHYEVLGRRFATYPNFKELIDEELNKLYTQEEWLSIAKEFGISVSNDTNTEDIFEVVMNKYYSLYVDLRNREIIVFDLNKNISNILKNLEELEKGL